MDQRTEKILASKKSTNVSIVTNIFLSIGQITLGVLGKSQGLIADGIHSLTDIVSDIIVLIALKYSNNEPDEDHQYGHHRYEDIGSLVLGTILVLLGIGIIWGGLIKINNIDSIPKVETYAIYVAGFAIISKEILFRYLIAIANKYKSSLLAANAWHARSDAASSLVVLLGILGSVNGYNYLDPIAGIIVGAMIVKTGAEFVYNSIMDLADRSIKESEIEEIRKTILNCQEDIAVDKIRTRKSGDYVIVDAYVYMDGNKTIEEGNIIVKRIKEEVIKSKNIIDIMLHIEPK